MEVAADDDWNARIVDVAAKCHGSAGHLVLAGGLPVRGRTADDYFRIVVLAGVQVNCGRGLMGVRVI